MSEQDNLPAPDGELTLQLPASQEGRNIFGDIYGGWLSAQIVTAAETRAAQIASGRVATVSIGAIELMSPVLVGTLLSFHTRIVDTGHSSIRIQVEVWGRCHDGHGLRKITEAETVQVALDQQGRIRRLPND
ncbi:acyl-CoA thioesterase [Motiliproteus coralliicola]|uniref:Acyl-CoA thioesterase n=1 Tax=Motiliproteus coralliicola TaxID=2283196 RepID=A0A369W8X6_9GAMM|nr:hotdog domain-containing protein [Motiliproteus coralliicola]RDE18352.1 acyl-CoA thioesterase [Motiliproteus coralliicola]